jgi:anion-transporting  ArsA/GET3 family ATPase
VAAPGLADRRLIFVTGKGGVGKTTVAAGLARALANDGKSVLLCSVDERDDLARSFGVDRLKFSPTKVDDRLQLMAMDTEASLRQYLKIFLRLPIVGRIGPIAAAFDFVATAAPGVKEILTIGKLCYEVRENHFDCVVVDAPSTGHVVGYLAAPQALNQLVRVGLIRSQTGWMLRILSDEAQTGVVVVTTAEEMPVSETIQLVEAIQRETTTHMAAVVVNRVLDELFIPRDAELVRILDATRPGPYGDRRLDGLFDAARLAISRREVITEHLGTLRAAMPSGLPIAIQPQIFDTESPTRMVRLVARSLTEELL